MIEIWEASVNPSMKDYIRKMDDLDLVQAIKSNEILEETGRWPANETIIHGLWEKFGSEPGSDWDLPRWKALQAIYYLIAKEAANRWSDSF